MNRSDNSITPNLDKDLRRVVVIVALLNIAYFGVEFTVALAIGSVSLFADGVDFLEDASVNLLILSALTWSARRSARVWMTLAGILLLPALAVVWALWSKFHHPVPPTPLPLTLTGIGALAVNLSCAFLLVRFRHHKGSLTRAEFLSARNDVLANIAIIGAGLLTQLLPSVWPECWWAWESRASMWMPRERSSGPRLVQKIEPRSMISAATGPPLAASGANRCERFMRLITHDVAVTNSILSKHYAN